METKEGKINFKFISSGLFFTILMVFLVFAVEFDDTFRRPGDSEINTTSGRNINFTFNATWDFDGETVGNCSLWTNISGTWESMAEFNGSAGNVSGAYNESSNITNSSISWINYTFSQDISSMEWSIACRNGTTDSATANLTFESNRTLAIDTTAPTVVETAEIFSGFNTSSVTPTITINITDINGSGLNLSATNGNYSVNITLFDDPGSILNSYTYNMTNVTCSPNGVGITQTQCTLDIAGAPLSNGTKNISVSVTDSVGQTTVNTSFTFTVDQIAPYYDNISIRTAVGDSGTLINDTLDNTGAQGAPFYVVSNWTDNLTQPFEIRLQILNVSNGNTWFNVNYTNITAWENGGWGNISYVPPTGHNMFEGKNISVRVNATDSLGNYRNSTESPVLLLLVNDTTAPTLMVTFDLTSAQLGERAVNFTNTSDTTPTIVWNVSDGNGLNHIAIQVDSSVSTSCNRFKNFTLTDEDSDLRTPGNRNGSITVSCTLTNGTHIIRLTAEDAWGNSEVYVHNFTVQTGEEMDINILSINGSSGGVASISPINKTNMSIFHSITFNASLDGGVATLRNMTWNSSCQTTIIPYTNGTAIYPFNYTGCQGREANQTVTVSATDSAGNSVSRLFQFAVDDLVTAVPAIHYNVADGFSTYGPFNLSVTAFDSTSKIDSIGYYLDGNEVWTDLLNHTISNGSFLTNAQGQNTSDIHGILNKTINHTGTHTLKIRVNDTLGNERNSSVITFTQNGPINLNGVNQTIADNNANVSNVSFFDASGALIEGSADVNQTLELYMELNNTPGEIRANVTINFNGSAANWNFTDEIYVTLNDSALVGHIHNNYTMDVADMVYFNGSFARFLSDDNYFGMVRMSQNGSLLGGSGYELWYLEDETDVSSRVNITECAVGFAPAHTTTLSAGTFPCWNSTDEGNISVDIFVPHFSAVVKANDSMPPVIINITGPAPTQTVSRFVPNITVSADAVSCIYTLNATGASSGNVSSSVTVTTVGINKYCTWPEIGLKDGVYNITFNVTDSSGNVNQTSGRSLNDDGAFTVSDGTVPNSGTISSSVTSSTEATVTITGVNESVNATVWYYGGSNTSLTSSAITTTFSTSPSVSLTGLTAEQTYYYNVTLRDYDGNVKRNGTFSFTTDAAAAAAAAASSSSSGSSGGGVAAGAASNVQSSKAQVWSSVAVGSSMTMAVNKANIGITEVTVGNVANELSNVEIKASSLKENPVSDTAAEKVYQYLQITKKNMKDEDVTDLTIKFRVTKTWLSENSLTQNDVALWRYKNNVWTMLSTTMASSDETYVNYEAETPGFSYFAIGNKIIAPEEVSEEEVPEEEVAPPTEEVEPGLPTPKPIEAPSKTTWPGWATFLVVVVAGLIIYFVFVKKKK